MKKQITQILKTTCFVVFCINAQAQVIEHVAHLSDSDNIIFTRHTSYNNLIYFHLHDILSNNTQLWVTDGTEEGTEIVKDTYAIGVSGIFNPAEPVIYNDIMYFPADGGNTGMELWRSNGTESGTGLLKDINPGEGASLQLTTTDKFTVFKDKLYFGARGSYGGNEMWVSDGTVEGTVLFKDLTAGSGSFSNYPKRFTVAGDKMFFQADDDLWVTDGTSDGTYVVKDIRPGGNDLSSFNRVVYNDKLYFTADDGTHGEEVWVSDGTESGTYMLKDISSNSSDPNNFFVFDNLIFFEANDAIHGNELWVSDGTTTGTQLLKDIGLQTDVNDFIIYNDKLYFVANGSLWTTDGMENGTQLIKDAGILRQIDMLIYDGKLLFIGDGDTGNKFWQSDGTTTGTFPNSPDFQLPDVYQGRADSVFTKLDGAVYFINFDDTGADLYRYRVIVTDTEDVVAQDDALAVYPNPSQDYIQINNVSPTSIQISNALGQVYALQEIQANEAIDIRRLPPGRYFITDKSNRQSATFIRQ